METFDALAKLVVIGDSYVGKTCLILRYTQDFYRENFLPTIGVDFKSKIVENGHRRYKLQLWDTAGQERYDSLRRGFYRGAKGVIVVYDITDMKTFENVTRWIEDINSNTGPVRPLILILGNKADLAHTRKVAYESGSRLAESTGATFGEVSAKTGEGIDEIFQEFVTKLSSHLQKDQAEMQKLGDIGHSIDVSDQWDGSSNDGKCCRGSTAPTSPQKTSTSKLQFVDVLI